jgi:hypothetical protein
MAALGRAIFTIARVWRESQPRLSPPILLETKVMKRALAAGLVLAALIGAAPAWSADDPRVENLALCRDSWLDWKNTDPAKLDSFGAFFRSAFEHSGDDAFFVPKSTMTIGGLKVVRVFPESVGMGVGFSVLVDATFDVARRTLEQELGKPLLKCETGDGMRACELAVAEQRTFTLAAGDPPNDRTTLVGCYYLYEK